MREEASSNDCSPFSHSLESIWGHIFYSVLHCVARQSLGKSVTLVENQTRVTVLAPASACSYAH